MKKTALSGRELGEANLAKVRTYIATLKSKGESLPMENGRLNLSAIARESDVLRNVFYTNQGVRSLIEEFAGMSVRPTLAASSGPSVQQLEAKERRILKLEQELAAVKAENDELRRRVSEAERRLVQLSAVEEAFLKNGRRLSL